MIRLPLSRTASLVSSLVLLAFFATALGTCQNSFAAFAPSAFQVVFHGKCLARPLGRMAQCQGGASLRGNSWCHARGGISAATCCDRRRVPPNSNDAETTILRSLSPGGSLRKGLSLPHVLASAAGGISLSSKIEDYIAQGDLSVSSRPLNQKTICRFLLYSRSVVGMVHANLI